MSEHNPIRVAIACGGTGGHLFPGVAVAEALQEQGAEAVLLVSSKEVDQQAVQAGAVRQVVTLPMTVPDWRRPGRFTLGCVRSWAAAKALFDEWRPSSLLAMGGFASVLPVLAARASGIPVFLHEANSIPGKANRLLAPLAEEIFVGFPEAAHRLCAQTVRVTGTPVRGSFKPGDMQALRMSLGLDPARPVLLVMGGSQGAGGINRLVVRSLPLFKARCPRWQFVHLTGPRERDWVKEAYRSHELRAQTFCFLTEMELALGAATAAVSRAGAGSIAELAAMEVPAFLIPYPSAADDHQFYNARAVASSGGAHLMDENEAQPEHLVRFMQQMEEDAPGRRKAREALSLWQFPRAAEEIAGRMLRRSAHAGIAPDRRFSTGARIGRRLCAPELARVSMRVSID